MAIEVKWYDQDGAIIAWVFPAAWSWGDFYSAFEHELALGREAGFKHWDVIASFTGMPVLPPGASVNHVVRTLRQRHAISPHSRILVVTANTFIRVMINVSITAYPQFRETFRPADSFATAERIIAEHRQAKRVVLR